MDQEEHGVHPQAERQEGNNLGGGGVEVDPNESGQTEAGADVHGDEEDPGQADIAISSVIVHPEYSAWTLDNEM